MTSGHTTQVGQQEERKKVPANRLIRTHNDGSCDGTHQLGEQFYRMGQLQSPGFSDFLRILNVLQLRTSKVIKFYISIRSIFGVNLTSDSDSGPRNTSKTTLLKAFPRHFCCAKFLGRLT